MASDFTKIQIDGQIVSTAFDANITAGAGQNVVDLEGYLNGAFVSAGGNDDYMYVNLSNGGATGSDDYVSFLNSTITGGNGEDYIFVYNQPSANNNFIINTLIQGGASDDRIIIVGDLDVDDNASDTDGLITIGEGSAIEGDGGSQTGLTGNDYITLDEVIIDSGVVRGQGGNDDLRIIQSIAQNQAIVNGNAGEDYIQVINSEFNSNSRIIGGANDDYISVIESLLTTSTWVNGSKGDDGLFIYESLLDGSDGEVVVRGNDGNDVIFFYSSAVSDTKVNGNAGDDYIVAVNGRGWTVNAGTFQSSLTADEGVNDSEILGGTGNDRIFFYFNTGGGNTLSGQEGSDVLWASQGELFPTASDGDRLDGGTGADWAFTGVGNDTYVFDSGDGVAATSVLASNLFENFFEIPGEGNDVEFNGLVWSDGVDVLITQDGIGGVFDLLDDDVEFNGNSFTVEDIVYFGGVQGSGEVGIATINEQGDFVSVVQGSTSAYVVLGAFYNIGQTGLQPPYIPNSETAFVTQYIEPGIGLNSDLEDYFDALGDVDAALFFDAGEILGVGNNIGYEEVSDLFILTTRDEIPANPGFFEIQGGLG
jgi:Ca2+-binding RTX toxin-like protein